jgi:STE24 endopeptidase
MRGRERERERLRVRGRDRARRKECPLAFVFSRARARAPSRSRSRSRPYHVHPLGNLLPLLLAVALSLLSLQDQGDVRFSLPGNLAFLAAWYALGRGLGGWFASEALREGADAHAALGRFRRAVLLYRSLTLPSFAVLLWIGGAAVPARRAYAEAGELAGVAAAFAPYVVLRVLALAATHPAEKRLGFDRLPFRRSILMTARLGALVVAPILLFFAILALGAWVATVDLAPFRALADFAARWEIASSTFALAALAGVLVVFPVLAMGILGARPMPAGPLRSRLEGYAARVGLRYRDLYVWPTGGSLPNAAVMGVGRRFRCVVFTDALLESLDEDEVEAVFAHEAGHAIHGHLPLFFAFTIAYSLAVVAIQRFLPAEAAIRIEQDGVLAIGLLLLSLVLYVGLLFGFISRRLEQQADVHGLLTVGLPEGEDAALVLRRPERHPFLRAVAEGAADPATHPFLRSLERIAVVVGGVRELTGWRHFSIKERVEFLDRFARDPAVRDRYRLRLRGLLALLGGVFVLCAAGAATDLPVQAAGPAPGPALDRARDALARGRPDEARRWIEEGLRGAAARGRTLSLPVDSGRVPPGRPVPELSLLALGQQGADPRLPRRLRFQAVEAEALLRSVLGRDGEAVACADRAAEVLGPGPPAALLAENRLLVAYLLRRDGRPAAADAARASAIALAREAGVERLARAAEGEAK